MVANKIYAKTHEGLTDLVSARVASQVLDNGLRARRCSAETVTVSQMASVLKGPVMKELSGILPHAGLERSLKKLLKTLKTLPPENTPPNPATAVDEAENDPLLDEVLEGEVADEAASDEAVSDVKVSDVEVSDVEVSDVEVSGRKLKEAYDLPAAADTETQPAGAPDTETAGPVFAELCRASPAARGAPGSGAGLPGAAQGLEPVAPPRVVRPLEPAARDRAMLEFAELEHVKMVAAFENGGVSSVLGQGFEVAALSRLGTLGLKLLSRSGELRAFYVAHAQGQLFLFPFGPVTLMLIGSSELNLGLVFATLQKLKEEL